VCGYSRVILTWSYSPPIFDLTYVNMLLEKLQFYYWNFVD
jgi:hypothetical protein